MSLGITLDALETLVPAPVIHGAIPVCQPQLLMSWPFFSLAKAPRLKPIDYKTPRVLIQVESDGALGIATIWDADILIWAASQIVQTQNSKRSASRRLHARPYDILGFLGRGRSKHAYDRLRHSLDRLKATKVTTSLGPDRLEGLYRFSWIDDWREARDDAHRAAGLEIFLSEWFYNIACQPQSCLTLDPGYVRLTGGLARWLYLLARKHGGRQEKGWSFDLDHLHRKSGSLAPRVAFIRDLRDLADGGRLLDYELSLTRDEAGKGQLSFRFSACGKVERPIVLIDHSTIVPSGIRRSCYRVAKPPLNHCRKTNPGSLKLYSKIDSKIIRASLVDNASPEASQRRQDARAFGDGTGAGSSPARSTPATPSQNALEAKRPKTIDAFKLPDVVDASNPTPPRQTRRVLSELQARKRIPLPGETS
jgi:plasmid replication initiation protein